MVYKDASEVCTGHRILTRWVLVNSTAPSKGDPFRTRNLDGRIIWYIRMRQRF